MLDIQQIRKDFPILQQRVYDKPLIYLDNGATTQKPQCVIDQIGHMYTSTNANIHRGVHFLSQQATELHEEARKTVARFINAKHEREIIFTRGTTEAINLIASSFCQEFCHHQDEIIISTMEHHSNIVPWQLQTNSLKEIKLKVAPINEIGELDLDKLQDLFTPQTKLLAITHISNVLGTINPIKEIVKIAHEHNVPVLVDAAQSIQHTFVDVQDINCDFLVFSGHKVYGPTGIGVLYAKESWLEAMPPYQGGGEMIATVTFEKTTYNELPFKFEAGTPDYIGSTALASALNYISNIGIDNILTHENSLLDRATSQLLTIDGMQLIGTASQKASLISFRVDGTHPYDVGMLLDKMGIAVRTGHHCAQPLMQALGIDGTIRASFALYNTIEEIDALILALKKVIPMLR